jgi:hypothetical protein
MFPFVVVCHDKQEYGHRVSFEPRNQDFDFDVKIDNLPFQVKTLIPMRFFPESSLDYENHQKYEEEAIRIGYLYSKNKLNQSYVERKVVDYVKNSCISQIKKSLEQKAKVVILDGTRTTTGFLLNQLFADDNKYVKFEDSLKKSIEMNSNQFVNVIFASGAYDYDNRISALAMKLPIKDGKIDEPSRDNTQLP